MLRILGSIDVQYVRKQFIVYTIFGSIYVQYDRKHSCILCSEAIMYTMFGSNGVCYVRKHILVDVGLHYID